MRRVHMSIKIGQLPIENENNCAELYMYVLGGDYGNEGIWRFGMHIVSVCRLDLRLQNLEGWESSNLNLLKLGVSCEQLY